MRQEQSRGDGGNGSSAVDYSTVNLPDKSRTEWHYTARRAELLQLVREAGHPGELNQTELAERYGVSQQQISKDLERLGQHIRENTSRDRWLLRVDSTLNRAIRGLLEDGDWYKAGKLALEYDEWMGKSEVEESGGGVNIYTQAPEEFVIDENTLEAERVSDEEREMLVDAFDEEPET